MAENWGGGGGGGWSPFGDLRATAAPFHPQPGALETQKRKNLPLSLLLGRGCDDGGEGGRARAVNRKPGSSAQGDEPALQGSPSIPKSVFFLAGVHPDVPFEGTGASASPLRIAAMPQSETPCDTKGSPRGCNAGGVGFFLFFSHFGIFGNIFAWARQPCRLTLPLCSNAF